MSLRAISAKNLSILVVVLATTLAILSSRNDSPIVDEVPHIGAGYSYVRKLDMRLNPEHPPLVKDLAGLPLLTLDINEDVFRMPRWTAEVNGQWTFGRAIIFNSSTDPDTIKTWARIPMLIFFLFSCWLMWRWASERYDHTGGSIAVILFAFSPTILAHARFVTTDMAAATGVLAATYCFMRFLKKPARKTFILSALSLGIAFLLKFNTILLAPYFALIAFAWGLDGRLRSSKRWVKSFQLLWHTALVGTTAVLLVVWPVYILQTWNYPPQKQAFDTRQIVGATKGEVFKEFSVWAADKPLIRGLGHWSLGLAMVQQRSAGGNTIYWLGEVVKQGGPWYFPIVYFLKEPLSWWILATMALTAAAFHRRRHQNEPKKGSWWTRNADEWIWLLWLAIYWVVSVRSTLNIGVRHLLPIYPFMILLVAGRLSVLLAWLKNYDKQRMKIFAAAIAVLLGWYTFETVNVHPFYLTYFNQIAGGPSGGHRYVVDSNLDWGQDAKRLGQWAEKEGVQRICVDYFGWADPAWYLKQRYVWTSSTQWQGLADFIERNQCGGWLAVSATFLQNSNGTKTFMDDNARGTYRWLLDSQPYAVIGNSIFVWKLE